MPVYPMYRRMRGRAGINSVQPFLDSSASKRLPITTTSFPSRVHPAPYAHKALPPDLAVAEASLSPKNLPRPLAPSGSPRFVVFVAYVSTGLYFKFMAPQSFLACPQLVPNFCEGLKHMFNKCPLSCSRCYFRSQGLCAL